MQTITNILDTSVKDYSLYTIFNRAIPGMDGLKPVHRKILYACNQLPVKLTKTFSFAGAAILQSNYHHGSASIEDAINKLTAEYNNVVPMLLGEGSFGNRLVPIAAATRYTSVKFNKKEFDKWFKDNDIAPKNPDPEYPEPMHYLPIIPWVLVNGTSGIATGFATEFQPHNPKVLARLCSMYLNNEEIADDMLPPFYPNFTGTIKRENEQWVCYGTYNRVGKTKLEITEVPIGYTMSKYIAHLHKLKSSGKIVNFVDQCSKSKFKFTISLQRGKLLTDTQLVSLFKLKRNLNENMTIINQHGEIEVFNSTTKLLKAFCDYRCTLYKVRQEKRLVDALALREWLLEKGRFIAEVLNDKIILKNKSSKVLLEELVANEYKHGDRLISIRVSSLCCDMLQDLKDEVLQLNKDIAKIKSEDPTNTYKQELKDVL